MTTILLTDCCNKTLSVEIKLHCDSNSQWVADSTLEVNMKEPYYVDEVVYKMCIDMQSIPDLLRECILDDGGRRSCQ